MSVNSELQQTSLGYFWGLFLPIGKHHRFFKIGVGLSVVYIDLSVRLNLCEEYKIRDVDNFNQTGECLGKREIDSASKKGYLLSNVAHINL